MARAGHYDECVTQQRETPAVGKTWVTLSMPMLVAGDNDTDKVQQHYWAVNVHIFHCTKLTSAASVGLWLSIH